MILKWILDCRLHFFTVIHCIFQKPSLRACSGSTSAVAASGYTGMTLDKQVTNAGGFDVYALGTASAGVAGSSLVLCFAYTSNYVFAVGTSRRPLALTVTTQ